MLLKVAFDLICKLALKVDLSVNVYTDLRQGRAKYFYKRNNSNLTSYKLPYTAFDYFHKTS